MPKNGKLTPWEILNKYPPVFVRLYAKERSGSRMHCALSDQEIAIRGNLPLDSVVRISKLTSWESVLIGDAEKFCKENGYMIFFETSAKTSVNVIEGFNKLAEVAAQI